MRTLLVSTLCSACLLISTSSFAQDANQGKDICDRISEEIMSNNKTKQRKEVGFTSGSSNSSDMASEWNRALFNRVIPLVGMYKDLDCDMKKLKDEMSSGVQ